MVLEDSLVAKAMRLSGARTKREVLHTALTKLVESLEAEREQRLRHERVCAGLLELEGIGWDGDRSVDRNDRDLEIDAVKADA